VNDNHSTEIQPVSEMHGRLISYRKQIIAAHEQVTAQHEAKLADLDAAIAAIVVRQPAPTPPQIELKTCRCGGTLRPDPASWNGLVHDRDGSEACQPGHSGPVAHPLDQTTRFPAVSPAQHPWQHVRHGQTVTVHWTEGGSVTGTVMGCAPESLVIHDGARDWDMAPDEVLRVEWPGTAVRADLDQTTVLPAASVTLPDEASA
jgi:hypothetical protein